MLELRKHGENGSHPARLAKADTIGPMLIFVGFAGGLEEEERVGVFLGVLFCGIR